MTAPLTVSELLARAAERGGSDLHVTAGSPPQIRVHGVLEPQADLQPLTPADTTRLVYGTLTSAQRQRFEETLELDVSFGIEGVARVRANVFRQRGALAAVYRLIPETIRGFDRLGLPPVVAELAGRPHGLVLVTGPTGSGKSTTLAALVDRINAERRSHILTIEDPIEYIHPHRLSIVNQREVHGDTTGFAPALRAALREDPDVVLIGEMRDLETTEAALRRPWPPCIRARRSMPSAVWSTSFPRISSSRCGPSSRWCSKGSCARPSCRPPTAADASARSRC